MEAQSPFVPFFDQALFDQYIHQLNSYIQDHAYQKAIQDATIAINQILQSQLLTILDIRARAYSLQYQPKAACADTQKMIQNVPELAVGYVRQGDILSMYGQQQEAINTYNSGLQNIKSKWGDHLVGIMESQKLETRIREVSVLANRCVDFFSRLPAECVYEIISFLSIEEKASCILVSESWRRYVFECIDVSSWEDFYVQGDIEDRTLVKAAPYFAHLTKTLTIDTLDSGVCSALLKHMENGLFKNIYCVKTSPLGSQVLQENINSLPSAFWKTQNTLRCLELEIDYNYQAAVKLADILSACRSVETLYFSTERYPMFWFTGDFKKLVQHNSLKNLELKSSIKITGKDIQNLIPRCPQLQRLVMHGCCPTVFYPIIKYSPPGLKIFGYNPLPGSPVPELQPTTPLGNEYQGLQILYVFNEEGSLPINDVLLLLYNNRTTLTTLHVGMSVPSPHTSVYDITCPDFKLENLVHLSFWGSSQIQDILFQKIQDLNALTTLNGENIYSLEPCFKNVKRLSSLISLNINHVDYPVKQDHTVQFFDMFSSRSKIGLPSLQEIALHNVPGVNDTILNVMGDIKTLQVVTLGGLRQISTAEINTFIQKLGCQLSRIRFVGMKTVTDDTIIGLCMSSNLATVDLESLEKVTRNSLQYLCDNAISNRLSEVRVKNCSAIGRDAIFRFTPIE